MPAPLNFDDWFNNYQATANSDAGQDTYLGPNQQAHDAYAAYVANETQRQAAANDPRNNQNIDPSTLGDSRLFGSNTGRWNWDEGASRWQPDVYQSPQGMGGFLGSGLDWHNDIAPGLQFVGSALGGAASGNYAGLIGPAGQIASNTSGVSPGGRIGNTGNMVGTGGTVPTQSNGLFDNLLGTVGNLSPALLAGYLGNSQRQDVMGQVGRLNDLAGSLNGPAFMQSITNPYDLQTGQGRTALSQSLQQRGVGGSSFGNQQLGNYDYQRGLGRGDLATRAGTAVAGTQGQLYSNALHGMVGANAAYNNLLGAGLGASGSLFNGGSGNQLAALLGGGSGGLSGLGGSLGGAWNSLFGTGTDPTAGTNPYPASNPGGQVDFGNDPSLASSSGMNPIGGGVDLSAGNSGNGLFDWLSQNGGDYGLSF